MTDITIGADPEVFAEAYGEGVISAYKLVRGDKVNPFPVPFGAIQVDGMALEFNIDPASCAEDFNSNIRNVLSTMLEEARSNADSYVKIHKRSSVVFSDEVMKRTPRANRVLGCEPDFNAWSMQVNPRPRTASKGLRTAGGHVHVGFGDFDPESDKGYETAAAVARQLDFALGLPSVLEDMDTARRTLYGAAGAFRPKSYGLEYRTLSNYWIFNEDTTKNIFNRTKKAVTDFLDGKVYAETYGDIQHIINSNDRRMAESLSRELGYVV